MKSYAHDIGVPPIVGRFFETRLASLFGLPEWQIESIPGDLDMPLKDVRFVVEVKASDNNHHWRISAEQLDEYLRTNGFPHDGCIYFLVGYRNRESRPTNGTKERRPLLAQCGTEKDKIESFLAQHINSIYIIDALLLEALYRQDGCYHSTLFSQREIHTVIVRRKWMKSLLAAPRAILQELGLSPRSWKADVQQMAISLLDGLPSTKVTVTYFLQRKYLEKVKEFISLADSLLPISSQPRLCPKA